jgi:hypothetical protein
MAAASNHGSPGFQLHIFAGLQGLQPVKDRAVRPVHCVESKNQPTPAFHLQIVLA